MDHFVGAEILKSGHMGIKTPEFIKPAKELFLFFHQNCTTDKIWLNLCGLCGNGKTTAMKAMFEMIRYYQGYEDGKYAVQFPFSCRYLTATELAEIIAHDRPTWNVIKNYQVLFVDDVGTEPAAIMDYGNHITPFVELITNRYNNRLGLVFTTNIPPKDMAARYGIRIADRLKECCEIVVFEGKDRKSVV